MHIAKTKPRVVLLTRIDPASCFIAGGLAHSHEVDLIAVVAESRQRGQIALLWRKLKRAVHQGPRAIFILLVSLPYLYWYDRSIRDFLKAELFGTSPICLPSDVRFDCVANSNSPETGELLSQLAPDFILVFGTRILVRDAFERAQIATLNWHMGITPEYRCAKSEFWALYNDEPAMVGLTLHVVDAGVDTGSVVAQQRLEVTSNDDERTLRVKALRESVPLLDDVIRTWRAGELPKVDTTRRNDGHYSTPSVFQYMALHRRLRTARR